MEHRDASVFRLHPPAQRGCRRPLRAREGGEQGYRALSGTLAGTAESSQRRALLTAAEITPPPFAHRLLRPRDPPLFDDMLGDEIDRPAFDFAQDLAVIPPEHPA